MENQPKLNNSKEIIVFLAERFPLCFTMEGEARPLKIGIFHDLVGCVQGEMNLSKTQLRAALRLYTSSWRYLYGIKAGVQRIDLNGNPCGVLDEQHAEYARMKLKEAKARVQARRTEQQAKRSETVIAICKAAEPHFSTFVPRCSIPGEIKPRQQARLLRPVIGGEQTHSILITDISKLQIGQGIKVRAGKSSMEAIVLEIAKGGVRVQLSTGLAMIVRAEHLQF